MADLPELTLPRGLPCWLAAGHGVELTPLYADVAMRTGHSRRRRVWRSAPRVVTVGLALSEPQMHRFFAWFEDTLRAGAEPFAAHLPNQGPGLLWWRAVFVEPPQYETRQKVWFDGQLLNAFRVTAKLLLTGSGSDVGPVDRTMASTATVAVYGTARLTVEKRLASESLVELLQATRLRSLSTVVLLPAPPLVFLTAAAAESAAASNTSSALLALAGATAETTAASDAASVTVSYSAAAAESATAAATASAVLSLFTPASLFASGETGFFYDFTDANTLYVDALLTTHANIGDGVVGVRDLSGNARHINTSGFTRANDGADYISFSGSTSPILTTGEYGSAGGYAVFVGMRPSAVSGTRTVVDSDYSSPGGRRISQTLLISSGGAYSLTFNSDGTNNAPLNIASQFSIGGDYVYGMLTDPTAQTLRVNSAQIGAQTLTKTPANSSTGRGGIGIGSYGTGTFSLSPYSGRMYALLWINRQLTSPELANVESWFSQKARL